MVFTRTRSTAIGAVGATGPNVQEPVESAYLFRLGCRINFLSKFRGALQLEGVVILQLVNKFGVVNNAKALFSAKMFHLKLIS